MSAVVDAEEVDELDVELVLLGALEVELDDVELGVVDEVDDVAEPIEEDDVELGEEELEAAVKRDELDDAELLGEVELVDFAPGDARTNTPSTRIIATPTADIATLLVFKHALGLSGEFKRKE